MLSKSLVRTGIIPQGLLLIIPATAMNVQPSYIFENAKAANVAVATNINDTLRTAPSDSVSFTVSVIQPAPTIQLNRNASKFVKSFINKEDEFLQKMKGRSSVYFSSIETVFSKYGLPVQMKYLAIVESELRTNAVSRVGAKGMWQLMPVTARELGLKVSGKYDERLQAYKSTVAAAKYLKALYAEFGDWLLVLAAYNGGPGTVYKAMKKSGSKNFWGIQSYLPEESRGHVKRFIAIHYFFEGTGSIATQTKAEAVAYQKKMEEHIAAAQLIEISKDTAALVAINASLK